MTLSAVQDNELIVFAWTQFTPSSGLSATFSPPGEGTRVRNAGASFQGRRRIELRYWHSAIRRISFQTVHLDVPLTASRFIHIPLH
jgi:hypothetical protein